MLPEGSDALILTSSNPLMYIIVIFSLALVPFLLLSVTSFIKLSIVFGILKNAIGAGQVPSGAIIALISIVLTMHIMSPVAKEVKERINVTLAADTEAGKSFDKITLADLSRYAEVAAHPIKEFLKKNAKPRERLFFAGMQSEGSHDNLLEENENFFSLLPAFIISELHEGFAIGFSLFLPFLILDLVIANLLVGLGMMMVSPVVISLPFKIVLFVICDGWFLLSQGLVLGYQ
jgi:type III secretion protein R